MIDITAKIIIVNSDQSLRHNLMLLSVCVVTADKYKVARCLAMTNHKQGMVAHKLTINMYYALLLPSHQLS